LAAGATALVCGFALGELDLVRAGCLAMALPLIAAVIMRRSQLTISSRRAREPIRVPSGVPPVVTLSIANRSLLPTGALMLEDQLPARLSGRARFVVAGLGGRESRSISYRLPALDRGRYPVGPLRLRLTDPFGLVDVTRSFQAVSTFLVAPIIEALPTLALPRSWDSGESRSSHSVGARGADDASTREYRQGDDLRKVHWRSSARTGTLMVRHEERPWQGQTSVLLDTRARAHRAAERSRGDARGYSSVEWAISCAASITDTLRRAGRATTLVAGELTLPTAATMLDHLALLAPSPAPDLVGVLEPMRRADRDSAVVAVLGQLDPESLLALSRLRAGGSRSGAFAILLDTPTWQHDGQTDPELPAAASTLRAGGWVVVQATAADTIRGAWSALLGDTLGNPLGEGAGRS
jgi:uncharacterized protein (DUF58 family)